MSARTVKTRLVWAISLLAALAILAVGQREHARATAATEAVRPLGSLKTVAVPRPSRVSEFVRDETAAIALGKALFWDMQVGSDGVQACASCHFHAGADSRSKNQLNPGAEGGDFTFQTGGPNYQLEPADFPFHRLADPDDRLSTVQSDSNDIASSQGVFMSRFVDVIHGSAQDLANHQSDPVWNVHGTTVRRAAGRNTPTNINAVFNFRNFWDGRAQNDFNGVNPFGSRDPSAYVLKALDANNPQKVRVSLDNASLASQAVGPALSPFEMSADGRSFRKIGRKLGRKMEHLRPLENQLVAPDDSVLGPISNYPRPGLKTSYTSMVQAAFDPVWWQSPAIITLDAHGEPLFSARPDRERTTDEYTQLEFNFSLFWGIALQMYEATLIADDTPFDRFMEGKASALTVEQQQGLRIFQDKGRCVNCHGGPELTDASVASVKEQRIERMAMADGAMASYDNGFHNIGVRPTQEDRGVGGSDPFGAPLADSVLARRGLLLPAKLDAPIGRNERIAVDGAFKTPGLRNVELTAPYYHNGGQLTLLQVVEFYNRGGDFRENNIDNLDADVRGLGLTTVEKNALVAFLKGLTDERVRWHRAPFDHPQLFVSDGHPGNQSSVTAGRSWKAVDKLREIPAVGARGYARPLPDFLSPVS
ncbi:MAG: Di-heme cytochrome c peroxidase [Betaproteobacteria bacterium]|nr:Di-heme cytochrome c peroxidase [Betaproteobacteria bacterium]